MNDIPNHRLILKQVEGGRARLEVRRVGRRPKSFMFPSYRAGLVARQMFEQRLGSPDSVPSPTVSEFAELWLDEYVAIECCDQTYRLYSDQLSRYVLPKLGHMRLLDVTRPIVAEFRAALLAEGTFGAAASGNKALCAMLSIAEKWGFVEENMASEARHGRRHSA